MVSRSLIARTVRAAACSTLCNRGLRGEVKCLHFAPEGRTLRLPKNAIFLNSALPKIAAAKGEERWRRQGEEGKEKEKKGKGERERRERKYRGRFLPLATKGDRRRCAVRALPSTPRNPTRTVSQSS